VSLAGKTAALHAASVAVILVDATDGPLPVNREDILLTRQFCRGTVMIGFSKSALVKDEELLDLEVMEVRMCWVIWRLSSEA
jgi:translation elongation factor EF-Tu-like GTPase